MKITLENQYRPKQVSIIGYIFTGLSILMTVLGSMALVMSTIFTVLKLRIPVEGLPESFKLFFQNYGLFALVYLIFAISLLISSINFLKLKAWTRLVLEISCWIFIASNIVFSILWLNYFQWIINSDAITSGPESIPKFLGIAIAIFNMIFWSVVIAVPIFFLRGKTVKGAFDKSIN